MNYSPLNPPSFGNLLHNLKVGSRDYVFNATLSLLFAIVAIAGFMFFSVYIEVDVLGTVWLLLSLIATYLFLGFGIMARIDYRYLKNIHDKFVSCTQKDLKMKHSDLNTVSFDNLLYNLEDSNRDYIFKVTLSILFAIVATLSFVLFSVFIDVKILGIALALLGFGASYLVVGFAIDAKNAKDDVNIYVSKLQKVFKKIN